jgi:hypothetical protein
MDTVYKRCPALWNSNVIVFSGYWIGSYVMYVLIMKEGYRILKELT